jgi:hypothetical protein
MSAMDDKSLKCLYDPLEDIDNALTAFANSPDDVREMSLREIAALIRFEQKMREMCDWLKKIIEATEHEEIVVTQWGGTIDSMEHPVIQRILARRKEAVDRAAIIRRQHIEVVEE